LLAQRLVADIALYRKHTFYIKVLRSIACVTLESKAADEIRITILFMIYKTKKLYELVVTSAQLRNDFGGLFTRDLRPGTARGPPVGRHRFRVNCQGTSVPQTQLVNMCSYFTPLEITNTVSVAYI
jgi:hypothetical protein